jgi:D-alanine transaminase
MSELNTRIYLNGEWLPPAEARVSVMDRGFLFGDGVYEVIPVYSRRPFRLDEHLARLQQSLNGIQLANPHSLEQWRALVLKLAAEAEWKDQSICMQVTRGPMDVRNHAFPAVVKPTVMIMAEPLTTPPAALRISGIATVSAADIRWLRCDLKATSLLANCLLRQYAVTHGCVETVLFRDGFLTEGAASSILVVKDGVLLAPIKNHLMLPGITYDVVLELAAAHGLPCVVRDITEEETRNADELWMASSTKEVLPITTLDGKRIGVDLPVGADSTPSFPVYSRMIAWYQSYKQEVMRHG